MIKKMREDKMKHDLLFVDNCYIIEADRHDEISDSLWNFDGNISRINEDDQGYQMQFEIPFTIANYQELRGYCSQYLNGKRQWIEVLETIPESIPELEEIADAFIVDVKLYETQFSTKIIVNYLYSKEVL